MTDDTPTTEEWRPILRDDVYKRYAISSAGRVYSFIRKNYLDPGCSRALKLANLRGKRGIRHINVAFLVLGAFEGSRPPGFRPLHLDGNSLNCRLDNLVWESRESRFGRMTGRARSEKAKRAKTDASLLRLDMETPDARFDY